MLLTISGQPYTKGFVINQFIRSGLKRSGGVKSVVLVSAGRNRGSLQKQKLDQFDEGDITIKGRTKNIPKLILKSNEKRNEDLDGCRINGGLTESK